MKPPPLVVFFFSLFFLFFIFGDPSSFFRGYINEPSQPSTPSGRKQTSQKSTQHPFSLPFQNTLSYQAMLVSRALASGEAPEIPLVPTDNLANLDRRSKSTE